MKKKKRRRRESGSKRLFSLLELCLSLSVLGIIASLLTWQTRDLYLGHQLQEGLKALLIDMRQMQSLALSHRTDFELTFHFDTKKKGWFYTCDTDEPIPLFRNRHRALLPGVKKIAIQGREVTPLAFSIYSSGRISPGELISFEGRKQYYELDLSRSPQIKLRETRKARELSLSDEDSD